MARRGQVPAAGRVHAAAHVQGAPARGVVCALNERGRAVTISGRGDDDGGSDDDGPKFYFRKHMAPPLVALWLPCYTEITPLTLRFDFGTHIGNTTDTRGVTLLTRR